MENNTTNQEIAKEPAKEVAPKFPTGWVVCLCIIGGFLVLANLVSLANYGVFSFAPGGLGLILMVVAICKIVKYNSAKKTWEEKQKETNTEIIE